MKAALFAMWLIGVIGLGSSILWALLDKDFREAFMLDPPLFRWVALPIIVLLWPVWVLLFVSEL